MMPNFSLLRVQVQFVKIFRIIRHSESTITIYIKKKIFIIFEGWGIEFLETTITFQIACQTLDFLNENVDSECLMIDSEYLDKLVTTNREVAVA